MAVWWSTRVGAVLDSSVARLVGSMAVVLTLYSQRLMPHSRRPPYIHVQRPALLEVARAIAVSIPSLRWAPRHRSNSFLGSVSAYRCHFSSRLYKRD